MGRNGSYSNDIRMEIVTIWEHETEDWESPIKKRVYHRGGDNPKEKKTIRKEYEIVEELSKDYNREALCQLMEVSRSGYYKWAKRKGKLNQYERNREIWKHLLYQYMINIAHTDTEISLITSEIRLDGYSVIGYVITAARK